jgi:hypothetical protein
MVSLHNAGCVVAVERRVHESDGLVQSLRGQRTDLEEPGIPPGLLGSPDFHVRPALPPAAYELPGPELELDSLAGFEGVEYRPHIHLAESLEQRHG